MYGIGCQMPVYFIDHIGVITNIHQKDDATLNVIA
jgi:hypothetical protein